MSEEQVENTHISEVTKPQLRKVDLNLLTIFDAVMQEQKYHAGSSFFGNVATGSEQCPGQA